MRALGAELRGMREKAGVSLRDMADEMGIVAPYLSDMERGNRPWSDARIVQFKDILKAL